MGKKAAGRQEGKEGTIESDEDDDILEIQMMRILEHYLSLRLQYYWIATMMIAFYLIVMTSAK